MKKTILLALAIIAQSCLYDHTDNTQELGNNYYYMGDGKESQILLSQSDRRSSGKTIVPEEVTHYAFNSEYIIARNIQDRYTKEIKFWIVDKRQEILLGPLDSIQFTKELQKLHIDIRLQPRK